MSAHGGARYLKQYKTEVPGLIDNLWLSTRLYL